MDDTCGKPQREIIFGCIKIAKIGKEITAIALGIATKVIAICEEEAVVYDSILKVSHDESTIQRSIQRCILCVHGLFRTRKGESVVCG